MRVDRIVLVVGVALLFPLQRGMDANKSETVTALTTLPPHRLLPVLSCGQGGTAADMLEITATNHLLSTLQPGKRMNRDHVLTFFQAITVLDPDDPDAVVRAAVFLATMADRSDTAVQMLEEAIERIPYEHPRRWVLHWELVAINLTTLAHQHRKERAVYVRRAGDLLMEISQLPGVTNPQSFLKLGQRLASKGLDIRESLEHEVGFWEAKTLSGEEAVRERARLRLAEVRCALKRERLQRALDAFFEQVGRAPRDLAELRQDQDDPLGVGFFRWGKRVVAPAYEASEFERALVPRHRKWIEAHDGVPSRADLGVIDLAPYLQLTVTREDVSVKPQLSTTPGGTLTD